MKKTGAILIAVALLLLMGCALAETSTVARSGALAAYLDGDGHLYLPGNETSINRASADALVSIDPYRVLFVSDRSDGTRDLYMIDLGSFNEALVVDGVKTACMADETTLYYVPSNDPTQLMRMNLTSMVSVQACTAAEPIDALYNSAEGLVFQQVDGTGTMIYNKLTGKFDSYLGALPTDGLTTDSFELYRVGTDLYLRDLASLVSEHIDSGVQAYAAMDGGVYYLSSAGSASRLKFYDPDAMTWQVVLSLDGSMERQLTASANALFLLDYRGEIYTVNRESGELENFSATRDISAYDLPEGYAVSELKLEAMDGQLNVYAELEDAAAQPSFSFIEFTSTSDSDQPEVRLLEAYAIDGEEPAWTQLKPAEQYSPLSRGSRGDAVRAIQKPLYDLGYYHYYVDGIFGPRTQYAVRLLQSDLNRPVTGVADPELQRIILNGGLSHYDEYLALTRGNRGLRVQIMQEKLRDLGYLADAADGIFGANTQRAVQLFQSENGLDISDGATRETLKRLYSGKATRCASFIDLYPGYTGIRVRELNNRLQALYYLEYNPGASYTAETAEAVREFQRTAGLTVNGSATTPVLRRLFSSYAPEAPGYTTLRRGDENDRVEALQKRLKDLNYYTGAVDGYFGKATEKAVKLFQKKVDLNVTGVATVRTQALLFAKDAPEYVKPTVISKPVITVERFDARQGDNYFIYDDTDSGSTAYFSWYVEGEVKEFNVRVWDDTDRVLLDQNTLLSRTGVALSSLERDRMYALTVTAYPEDGNKNHITSATIGFVRCKTPSVPVTPVVGTVSTPEIFIKTVLRSQGGVQFVQPGEVALHWHADGALDRYYVEIFNSDGGVLLTTETRDEQTSFSSSKLTLGKTYTMYVYAIPTNGTIENATTAAEHFALEDLSVPTPTPEPLEPDITPEPIVTVAPDDDPALTVEPADAAMVEVADEDPVVTLAPEVAETPEPVEDTPEPVVEEAPVEDIPEPVVEEASEPLTPPTLSFETTVEQRDGISYVADDLLVMSWQCEGDVQSYHVKVVDSADAVLAEADTTDNAIRVRQGNVRQGETYTLVVTAYPADGGEAVTASARFALYQEEAPEAVPETPVEEEYVEEPYVEEPYVEEPYVEEPYVEEPYVEEPYVEEPYVEEPNVEEPYVEEPYVEEPDVEEPYVEEPYVEEPFDVEEEPVVEQPVIEEPVVEEPVVEEPVVEQPAVEEPVGDANVAMDPETAARAQDALVGWGWLAADSFERGAADEPTLLAIDDFETWYNAAHADALNGVPLASADGLVDTRTLGLLLNEEGTTYPKPEDIQ